MLLTWKNPTKHKNVCYITYELEDQALQAVAAMNRIFMAGV